MVSKRFIPIYFITYFNTGIKKGRRNWSTASFTRKDSTPQNEPKSREISMKEVSLSTQAHDNELDFTVETADVPETSSSECNVSKFYKKK